MRSGRDAGHLGRKRPVELDVLQFDAERAAGRHGVARIHAQVHQDLMELRRVAEDRPHFRGMHCSGRYVLGKRLPHDCAHVAHNEVQLHRLMSFHPAAAEAQELADDGSASFGAGLHRGKRSGGFG